MRVRHRDHVGIAVEVLALDVQLLHHVAPVHLVEIPAVEALQDLENAGLRIVQSGVNRGEHLRALLDQCLRGADRHVVASVRDLLLGGGHHTLGGVGQEPHELEQGLARRVERHWHRDFANVVHARCALDLGDLRHFDVLRLARDLRALELEHRRGVVDVGRVEQRTEATGDRGRKTADQVRESDRVSTTPRDELELDQVVELGHRDVALLPVTVQADDLGVLLVDHHDVRGQLAFGVRVVFPLHERVHHVHAASPVDVLLPLLAFDLVVRLVRTRLCGLHRSADDRNVAVQTRVHARLEFLLRDVLHLGHALRGVEVRGGERQNDVVDRYELGTGALFAVVVPKLQELGAAQRQLR